MNIVNQNVALLGTDPFQDALVQNLQVNSLNELTINTNGGTLTVAGTTSSMATNVTVNGTNAIRYGSCHLCRHKHAANHDLYRCRSGQLWPR